LKGKYPKEFKFTGWHPQCRCLAIPILKTPEELMQENEAILEGEEPDKHSVNEVKDVPENFKKWVTANKGRIERAEKRGTLPYFLKDNKDYTQSAFREKGIFNSTYLTFEMSGLTPTDKLDLSDVNSVMGKIAGENSNYFQRGYTGVFTAPDGEKYFMSTDINGRIFVNFAEKNGFDAGASLVSAFEKLKKGIVLTEHEEYSIEVLWHEILHNKTKNTVILPPIAAVNVGFQRVVAETVNQLVARHTYPDFLSELGGKSVHQDWVLKNGYGYSDTVNNLRKLLSTLNIDEDVFVEKTNELLMKDYTNFDEKIRNMVVKASKRRDTGNVIDAFNMLDHKNFDNFLKILNK
jgi:hypothetical protein